MNVQFCRALGALLAASGLATGACSNDCVPTDTGGVIVTVTGVPSCDGVIVSAVEGTQQYPFEFVNSGAHDAGVLCRYQGLTGHPGTFTVQVAVGGQTVQQQPATLHSLDSCNVTAQELAFDVGAG